jgi:TrpR-related protein YerC/YecD
MKSHHNVSPRQEALAERNLYAALAALRSAEECRAFLRDLCTPAEIQAMADRWSVVEFLQRGLPYREIHRLTGVSVTTIGRVARFLAGGNGGYAVAVQRTGRTGKSTSRSASTKETPRNGATKEASGNG